MSETEKQPWTPGPEEIKWRYRENQDSEFAETEIADLKVLAQDCDGDFSYWHVKRGDKFLVAGEIRWSHKPYHFDVARERAVEVAKAVLQAEKYNSMQDCPLCGDKTGNENCPHCNGFGFVYAATPERASSPDMAEALEELDAEFDKQVYLSGSTDAKAQRDADLDLPPDYEHCVIITEALWDKVRAALNKAKAKASPQEETT